MRSLAASLGVTPNAIYNHVRDKTELIDAMLDDALAHVETPHDADPRTFLRGIMTSTYDVLTQRRDLVPLYLDRRGARGPNAIALGEQMHHSLSTLGIDQHRSQRIVHVLIVQVIGFAAYGPTAPDPLASRDAFIASIRWTLDGALRPESLHA